MILLNKKFDLTVFLTSTTGTSRTNSSNASWDRLITTRTLIVIYFYFTNIKSYYKNNGSYNRNRKRI